MAHLLRLPLPEYRAALERARVLTAGGAVPLEVQDDAQVWRGPEGQIYVGVLLKVAANGRELERDVVWAGGGGGERA